MNAAREPAAGRRFWALLGVAGLWLLAALPFLSGCPIATLTHHPCPGCGMTRAFLLLFAGDLRASLAMHPLAVPTALAQAALAAGSFVAAYRYGAPWVMFERRWGRVLLGLLVIVLVADFVLWIARGCGAFGGSVPV